MYYSCKIILIFSEGTLCIVEIYASSFNNEIFNELFRVFRAAFPKITANIGGELDIWVFEIYKKFKWLLLSDAFRDFLEIVG